LGWTGNDVLFGDNQFEIISLGGNNRFEGGVVTGFPFTADDILYGEQGNDQLYGGYGNDQLYGGNNNDTLYGEDGWDTLDGGSGNDDLNGGAGNDYLKGENGNDYLRGGANADYLVGGADIDQLWGEDGNDTLDGGDGEDNLIGGTGVDYLEGGSGADTFNFIPFGDTGDMSAGQADTIADFHDWEGDQIWLDSIYGDAGNISNPGEGQFGIWQSGADWVVTYNSTSDVGFHDIIVKGSDPHGDIFFPGIS
jgi:Ca2+-binding RTX toxin-like protein